MAPVHHLVIPSDAFCSGKDTVHCSVSITGQTEAAPGHTPGPRTWLPAGRHSTQRDPELCPAPVNRSSQPEGTLGRPLKDSAKGGTQQNWGPALLPVALCGECTQTMAILWGCVPKGRKSWRQEQRPEVGVTLSSSHTCSPLGRCLASCVLPPASLRTPVGTRLALTAHDLAALGRQHLRAGSAQWRVAADRPRRH